VIGGFSALSCYETGMAFGNRGQWAEALADFRRAFELGGGGRNETSAPIPDPSLAWLYRAVLEFELGDRDTYRAHCRRMVDRFERSTDAGELERTAKAGLLDPPPSWEEVARLRSLVRSAVERAGPDNQWLPWYLLALGLAEYRAGDSDAALKALDRCLAGAPGANLKIPGLSVQAMALARKGQSLAAQDRLDQAKQLLAEQLPTMAAPDWPDRLIARRLFREAEALIRFDPIFPANPFAR
jgi:tetratricopeptide (TPR) repeat protein